MQNLIFSAASVYEGGTLPTLVYANKQQYGNTPHDRPMHSHDSICELLVCYRGFGTYFVNQSRYSIQAGDILFYNMGELHEVSSDIDAEIGTYCFGLTDVHLRGLRYNHLVAPGSAHVRAAGTRFPLISQLAEQILQHCTNRLPDLLTAQLAFNTLLMLTREITGGAVNLSSPSSMTALAMRARAYMDAHFTEPLTLENIAAKLQCSVTYVSHAFKEYSGHSPIQYIIRRRIGQAQTLLISNDCPIAHIAEMVGYSNPGHFHQLFLKTVGMTPAQYRKHYLETLHGNRAQW